jgi:ubiquitin carboxyl-terminal hydrolase 14
MSDATIATATATASSTEETTTKEDKGKGPVLGGDLEEEGIYRAREAAEFEALVDSSLKNDLGCSTTGLYELVAIVTHKGAAADSGHYIGFVKKSVFYAANAKAKAVNDDLTRKLNLLEELVVNTPLPDSLESGATDPMITSVVDSLLNRSSDPGAMESSLLANAIQVQGNNDSADSNSAPVPGPSTIDLEAEEDENWYKFDDEKVTEFPKEKLPTLEGGGEDSSAYVLVYRSKAL